MLLALSAVTLLAAAPALWAESPSDLMEQGVYSEETKGDLDTAIGLYQKVVEQAKADQALAARAQYHLGVSYYKQKNFSAADTAFQTLVKDYPQQKDMVALARKYLAGAHALQPAPWTDGEHMRLDIKLASGLKVGMADYSVTAGQSTNGQKIWRFSSHMTIGGMESVSHVEVDADTMAPIHSVWKHTLLGEVDAVYYPDHADLKTTGKDGVVPLKFDEPVIDNEESIEWMRRISLTDGYSNSQPVLASLASHVVPVSWVVSGPEQVQVPAGAYNCYKVTLSINQSFWYTADANHYLVKFEGGGATAELTGVTHRSPDQTAVYNDATNGVSLTAPAGWSFDREESDTKGKTDLRIIDPEGLATSSLTVENLDVLSAEQRKSVRDYANTKITASSRLYTDFQVRTNTWKDRPVAGQPGVSVICEFTQAKTKKVGYGVWSFGPTNGVYFEMITSAKDFDTLLPEMDAIIDSYNAK